MGRKLSAESDSEYPTIDGRPIPDARPIPLFPTKDVLASAPVPREIPWVKDLPPLVIDISVMDRTALWLHDRVRYAKWAVFLLRLTVRTIQIIQSTYSPHKEQSNG